MPERFPLHPRAEWRARRPRSRVARNPRAVTKGVVHWPAVAGRLATPTALRVDEYGPDADCVLPAELIERLDRLNHAILNGRIDTRAEEAAFMRDIQNFHMDGRDWSDFAYNYGMFLSGHVWAGRTFKYVPASNAPDNTESVSICVMMGTEDRVSAAVRDNLRDVFRWFERYARHEIGAQGHRQINPTTCPGDRLQALVPSLNRL